VTHTRAFFIRAFLFGFVLIAISVTAPLAKAQKVELSVCDASFITKQAKDLLQNRHPAIHIFGSMICT
jgi:hypothetical protein